MMKINMLRNPFVPSIQSGLEFDTNVNVKKI